MPVQIAIGFAHHFFTEGPSPGLLVRGKICPRSSLMIFERWLAFSLKKEAEYIQPNLNGQVQEACHCQFEVVHGAT